MNYNKRLKHEVTMRQKDGEIATVSKEFSVSVEADEYFYTFISAISWFYEINCITDVKILAYMCEHAEFNSPVVRITPVDRKELVRITGIKTQGISNAISRLSGLGLISGSGGVYEINPEIWWKGSMKTRRELLESKGMELKFKFKKRLVNENGKLVDKETGEVVK